MLLENGVGVGLVKLVLCGAGLAGFGPPGTVGKSQHTPHIRGTGTREPHRSRVARPSLPGPCRG